MYYFHDEPVLELHLRGLNIVFSMNLCNMLADISRLFIFILSKTYLEQTFTDGEAHP